MAGVELTISGIKCDYCDYRDDSVEFSDYPKWLDKPCPHCGHNLLTETDYYRCLKTYNIVDKYNKVINVLKWLNPRHYWRLIFGDKRKQVTFHKHFTNEK